MFNPVNPNGQVCLSELRRMADALNALTNLSAGGFGQSSLRYHGAQVQSPSTRPANLDYAIGEFENSDPIIVPNQIWTQADLGSLDVDGGEWLVILDGNSSYKYPVIAPPPGLYKIGATFKFSPNAVGTRRISLRDPAGVSVQETYIPAPASGEAPISIESLAVVDNLRSFYSVWVYQDSGEPLSQLVAASGFPAPWWAIRVTDDISLVDD